LWKTVLVQHASGRKQGFEKLNRNVPTLNHGAEFFWLQAQPPGGQEGGSMVEDEVVGWEKMSALCRGGWSSQGAGGVSMGRREQGEQVIRDVGKLLRAAGGVEEGAKDQAAVPEHLHRRDGVSVRMLSIAPPGSHFSQRSVPAVEQCPRQASLVLAQIL
jgi:hypothetical protein